jgi:hypothetical protein
MKWLKTRKAEISMGSLFIVFLLIVFALALTPTIGDASYDALWNSSNVTTRGPTNITGPSRALVELIPLVWVFIVVGIGAAAVVEMFENLK